QNSFFYSSFFIIIICITCNKDFLEVSDESGKILVDLSKSDKLRMSYNTWTSSSFLGQSDSDYYEYEEWKICNGDESCLIGQFYTTNDKENHINILKKPIKRGRPFMLAMTSPQDLLFLHIMLLATCSFANEQE
ncbi:hypothetical protein MHK_004768, partial [Candidatus Magnetomorum sp. HK-1]